MQLHHRNRIKKLFYDFYELHVFIDIQLIHVFSFFICWNIRAKFAQYDVRMYQNHSLEDVPESVCIAQSRLVRW